MPPITAASRSKISPNRCSQNGANIGIIMPSVMMPKVMVTGKPITKTDSCGVMRLSKPSAMFSVNSRQISGSASIMPLMKISEPTWVSTEEAVAVQRLRLDRQGVEAVRQQRNQPQMAVEAEEQQHRQQVEQARQHRHVRAAAGIEEGGERQAHLHADHFPAVRTAAKANCMVNPSATPIRIC